MTLLLFCGAPPNRRPVRLLLDVEPQRSGEGERATALRLLKRVLAAYPRALDVVLADAYYAVAPFLNFLLSRGKHALVVFKQKWRDVYQDATGRWAQQPAQRG